MFKMSAFSCDARHELFAKAQSRFADCFIGQVVPDSLHSRIRICWILWFWFRLTETY